MIVELWVCHTCVLYVICSCPVKVEGCQLYIHLVLDCVHKDTDIYDGMDLMALKRVDVVERGSTPYPYYSELSSQIQGHL